MGLQRVWHDWETVLNWEFWKNLGKFYKEKGTDKLSKEAEGLGSLLRSIQLDIDGGHPNQALVKVKLKSLSRVRLFATPWTVAYQASLSMEFSRQEYCSGLPFPSPGDLPDPETEPKSPALLADTLPSEPPGKSCVSRTLIIFSVIGHHWRIWMRTNDLIIGLFKN